MRLINPVIIFALLLFADIAIADDNVRGHFREDGKYVQHHKRSHPDNRRYNNYSSKGKHNPYTGKKGTQRNELSKNPARNKRSP